MKILLLGPRRENIINFLISDGHIVYNTEESIDVALKVIQDAEFIISYGYRHIIKDNVLAKFPRRAINLHISYLPWNKGADPNLWSFIDDTIKGITIHYLDPGIDSGDIIIQKIVTFEFNDTLRTSYNKLAKEIEELFINNWHEIKNENIKPYTMPLGGSYHKISDRKKIEYLLSKGWDTPVKDLIKRD